MRKHPLVRILSIVIMTGLWAAPANATNDSATGGPRRQEYLSALTRAEDTYVAVGGVRLTDDGSATGDESLPLVLRSKNGTRWVEVEVSPPTQAPFTQAPLTAITFGEGFFVAVGGETLIGEGEARQTHIVLVSDDAKSWTEIPVSGLTGAYFNSVGYVDGRFVAITSEGVIWTSEDGGSWTERQALDIGFNPKLTAGGGYITATGEGNAVLLSTDGLTWSTFYFGDPGSPSGWTIDSIFFHDGQFRGLTTFDCCFGEDPALRQVFAFSFPPATPETGTLTPVPDNTVFIQALDFFNGRYLGAGSNIAYRSPDLLTWSQRPFPANVFFRDVLVAEGSAYLLAEDRIVRSTNGVGWRPVWTPGK